MRYVVGKQVIRSENAAKSVCQPCSHLVNWLRGRTSTDSALDYGCGKLRYTAHVAARSRDIGIVDSAVQLMRTQLVAGQYGTVAEYAARTWPGCRIYTVDEFFEGIADVYDFVLCANVLSAIPSRHIRAKSLAAIRASMRDGGQLLVANQHVNSYFRTIQASDKSRQHLDGWITDSRRGRSYYGILRKERVASLLQSAGFHVMDAWIAGSSNYVLAAKEEL